MYNSAPVTIVVGNTWQGIVGHELKDVLIIYYVPGDEQCNEAMTVIEELGKHVKDI